MSRRRAASPYRARTRALVEARWEHGWTQAELAERTGLSEKAINHIEHGTIPRGDNQRRIAEVLGGDPADYWPHVDDLEADEAARA